MEHIYHIRYEHKVNGKSIRAISRETGHDVKTVKKYIAKENFSPDKPSKKGRKSKTDKYREKVKEWLLKDESAPRHQNHTAHRVYNRLIEDLAKEGRVIDVSERSIRTLVSKVKSEIGQSKEAALPLLHPAGEAQVDFGKTTFIEKGITYEGHHLCITFPHSDAKLIQLFKGENLECLMKGLTDIFIAVGGIPRVIRFDNMSTAVKEINAYGEREVTEGFRRLQCHYGFESNFCNPASGREKGSVENYVGCSRRNYFVPLPEFDDLKKYNEELMKKCLADMNRSHYRLNANVKDLFEEDKEAFLPLPEEKFDCCKYIWAKTNIQGMAIFDKNRYSTSGSYPNKRVLLEVTAHDVIVYDEDHTEIVSHPRLYGKGKVSMLWAPYLNVLSKRPNALKYTGFFESLDKDIREFLHKQDLPGKKAILTELAKSCEKWGMHKSLMGIGEAVKMGAKDADAMISAFHFAMNMPGKIQKNKVPAGIPQIEEYALSLSEYGKFMEVNRHV
ncbi:MAG: IS21 family transposase [Anaerovoracaceae bacterium]